MNLKDITVDQLITDTKLVGSASEIVGVTTPEGWPFVVVVAVAKPGNERVLDMAKDFHRKITAATQWSAFVPNEEKKT